MHSLPMVHIRVIAGAAVADHFMYEAVSLCHGWLPLHAKQRDPSGGRLGDAS